MRIFGTIEKVAPQANGSVRVHGSASSEVKDKHGEIILASAVFDALPDFFRHGSGALREMHSAAVAAGTVDEVEVGDDKITRIIATVVDAEAIKKIKARVYKSFSVGGRVLARDPDDRKIITAIELNEISLVDVGANPEAKLELFKAVAGGALTDGVVDERLAKVLADRGRLAKRLADSDRAIGELVARVESTAAKVDIVVSQNQDFRKQIVDLNKRLSEKPCVAVDNVLAAPSPNFEKRLADMLTLIEGAESAVQVLEADMAKTAALFALDRPSGAGMH
jgi:hypothetical protein